MKTYSKDSAQLFEDIKSGKAEAYEYVFKTYYPMLKAYATRYIPTEEDLNDILQDCFTKLWLNREQLKPVSISSLLYTMVRNACLNFIRQQLIRNQRSIDDLPTQQESESLYSLFFHHNPEEELVYQELLDEIDQILNSLPYQSKQIFYLSRQEGLKNREIAERLNISIKTVEYHISKALTMLKAFAKKHQHLSLMLFIMALQFGIQ